MPERETVLLWRCEVCKAILPGMVACPSCVAANREHWTMQVTFTLLPEGSVVVREDRAREFMFDDCSQGCILKCKDGGKEVIDSGECIQRQWAYLTANGEEAPEQSPWQHINQVLEEADLIVSLTKLRMESGVSEEDARAWALVKISESQPTGSVVVPVEKLKAKLRDAYETPSDFPITIEAQLDTDVAYLTTNEEPEMKGVK